MSAIRTSGRQSRSCPETGFGEVSDRSAGRFVGNAEVGFRLAGCRATSRAIQSVSQSSQVQTVADYAKLSLSNEQPIMLALKKFIPCYAAALCIKTHAALLALCDAPHNASSRTGIRTWLLPSLVHKPRKAAEKASCCCEAGSLAIAVASQLGWLVRARYGGALLRTGDPSQAAARKTGSSESRR